MKKIKLPSKTETILVIIATLGIWFNVTGIWFDPHIHPFISPTTLFLYISLSAMPFMPLAYAIKKYVERNDYKRIWIKWLYRTAPITFVGALAMAIITYFTF